MTNSEKLSLAIISLMRTFLSSYEEEEKKYKVKTPKHTKKLINRVAKGMYLSHKKDPDGFKDTINRVNKIYLDAIEAFKEKDVVVEIIDTCMRLYLLDEPNLQSRYFITDKLMTSVYQFEADAEFKHEKNAREIIDFFEKRLFNEFEQPLKKKFSLKDIKQEFLNV